MTPQQFKDILTDLRWSQTYAADRLYVSRITIYNWLNGVKPITPRAAAHIRLVHNYEKRARDLMSESD